MCACVYACTRRESAWLWVSSRQTKTTSKNTALFSVALSWKPFRRTQSNWLWVSLSLAGDEMDYTVIQPFMCAIYKHKNIFQKSRKRHLRSMWCVIICLFPQPKYEAMCDVWTLACLFGIWIHHFRTRLVTCVQWTEPDHFEIIFVFVFHFNLNEKWEWNPFTSSDDEMNCLRNERTFTFTTAQYTGDRKSNRTQAAGWFTSRRIFHSRVHDCWFDICLCVCVCVYHIYLVSLAPTCVQIQWLFVRPLRK